MASWNELTQASEVFLEQLRVGTSRTDDNGDVTTHTLDMLTGMVMVEGPAPRLIPVRAFVEEIAAITAVKATGEESLYLSGLILGQFYNDCGDEEID
jgi:hypothetical protein